jgi:hypothetical protein
MRIIGLDIHRAFAEAVAWHDGKLKRLGRVDMRDSIPRSVISVHNSLKASTPGRRSNQRHDPCPAQGAHSTPGSRNIWSMSGSRWRETSCSDRCAACSGLA